MATCQYQWQLANTQWQLANTQRQLANTKTTHWQPTNANCNYQPQWQFTIDILVYYCSHQPLATTNHWQLHVWSFCQFCSPKLHFYQFCTPKLHFCQNEKLQNNLLTFQSSTSYKSTTINRCFSLDRLTLLCDTTIRQQVMSLSLSSLSSVY